MRFESGSEGLTEKMEDFRVAIIDDLLLHLNAVNEINEVTDI